MKVDIKLNNVHGVLSSVIIKDEDVYCMTTVLSHIIYPMLKQFNNCNCAFPDFKEEDLELLPEDVRQMKSEEKWQWILDEMTWAFEQQYMDWEDQYYSGTCDIYFEEIEGEEFLEMKYGPNHTFSVDEKGLQSHYDRMQRGFKLFGQHFLNLWV